MSWVPANISATCQQYPTLPSCQPSILSFLAFLVQNFGHSYDNNFSDDEIHKNIDNEKYDFIVVGAGAAGCVVTNRLSEIEGWKVLLLEAGGEEPVIADVPAFFPLLQGSSIDWKYQTQPEPYACNNIKSKRCGYPRGKVMGGSTSINGMVYIRGSPKIYDKWADLGNVGWSYEDVLPYFLKSEDNQIYKDSEYHSTGGYLTVNTFPYQNKNSSILTDAWKELGYSVIDYNGYEQIGIGETVSATSNGVRLSMNGAFIRPIRGRRPNLTIKTNTLVTKIIIDPTTKRAIGVEYSSSGDKKNLKRVYANKEVILSAGSIESPKLLMLSGIGHASELEKSGINVLQDLPVGDNFQDHVILVAGFGIWNTTKPWNTSINIMKDDAVYWQDFHKGPSSDHAYALRTMVFDEFNKKIKNGVPNVQIFHFTTMIENIDTTGNFNGVPSYIPSAYNDAFCVLISLSSPESRGTVRLNETDPVWSQPVIQPNFLTRKEDRDILVTAALKTTHLFKTSSLKTNRLRKYKKPAEACKNFKFESREYFECLVKINGRPVLHAAGTCKMGPENDIGAVVDPRLRVYGIENLRVIDASIMPLISTGNSFAPTVMIGEKGSDFIKEDWLGVVLKK